VKIRFLTTIPVGAFAFHYGQVIEVDDPTPDMLAWLEPLPDGTRRAEVVREDDVDDVATVTAPEVAVTRRGKRTARGA
jgi:hypothetical protein